MNNTERSLAEAVRDSINHTTPGGYHEPDQFGAYIIGAAYLCGLLGLVLALVLLS